MKTFVTIGLLIGSTIGGYIPALWGAGLFSLSSMLLSAAGGIAGIYLGFKFAQSMDLS